MKNFNSQCKLKILSCFENTRNYIKSLLSGHNHLSPYKPSKTELYLTQVSEMAFMKFQGWPWMASLHTPDIDVPTNGSVLHHVTKNSWLLKSFNNQNIESIVIAKENVKKGESNVTKI